jgi:hypothetical protein
VPTDILLRRIGTIKNANQWKSFVATLGGINAGHRANASIRVHPTTVSQDRWSDTEIQALSLWKTSPGNETRKRPRNVANAISRNEPNAKSHGSSH